MAIETGAAVCVYIVKEPLAGIILGYPSLYLQPDIKFLCMCAQGHLK